jgi:general secretion pathway protein B
MSSILKALKKLENDKRICRPDQLGIDAKILQDVSSTRFSRTAVSLIALALFVCGSGATYFFMKHDAADVIIPQTIAARTESRSQPPVPAVIPPVLKKSTPQTTSRLLSPKAPPDFEKQKRSPNYPAKSSRPPLPEKHVETTPIPETSPVVSLPIAPTSAVPRPALTVNGIAYQDGGSDNLAVINGITVSSGDVIEGIKVEDIQKDRVRFSHGGEKFEIILNKSNR